MVTQKKQNIKHNTKTFKQIHKYKNTQKTNDIELGKAKKSQISNFNFLSFKRPIPNHCFKAAQIEISEFESFCMPPSRLMSNPSHDWGLLSSCKISVATP